MYFYPRSPCGERHAHPVSIFVRVVFLSTLSLRRATVYVNYNMYNNTISIHALLAESDEILYILYWEVLNFYPRSPCGERRGCCARFLCSGLFLSTLSLRRATCLPGFCRITEEISIHALLAESDGHAVNFHAKARNFYPRSPCGERLSR